MPAARVTLARGMGVKSAFNSLLNEKNPAIVSPSSPAPPVKGDTVRVSPPETSIATSFHKTTSKYIKENGNRRESTIRLVAIAVIRNQQEMGVRIAP